ncbi:hypothetical protein PIB30_056219 [Stylosanthes scabra]|uniref:Protein kinase domain-containing protein n=1 Tax=Stylosanthes scabra TaxID=79078 RepID=A0ABU6QJP8_9FABA|nr:hypothetical protein [Stylosanthes scabra]
MEEANNGSKVKIGVAIGGTTVALLCVLLLVLYFIYIRGRGKMKKNAAAVVDHFKEEDLELPLFDLSTIAGATNNFTINNKLGEGGFGPVYKGTMENGQEIAVKTLSRSSGQGLKEFKNEIVLIAKLQHRNLAWDLWREGRHVEVIDEYLKGDLSEALRCVHISLLCVQEHAHDRPNMSSVVMMLGSEISLEIIHIINNILHLSTN